MLIVPVSPPRQPERPNYLEWAMFLTPLALDPNPTGRTSEVREMLLGACDNAMRLHFATQDAALSLATLGYRLLASAHG